MGGGPPSPTQEWGQNKGPDTQAGQGAERPGGHAEYLLARRLVRRATRRGLRGGHAGAVGPGRCAGARLPRPEAAGSAVGQGAADRRGARAVAEREQPEVARDPGWRAGSLALAEVAAAALPLRLQKAPEADSNSCQTRQRTWPPRHVARAREPSSRPPRPFCSPQGSLKGPVASTGSLLGREGLKVFARSSAPDAREAPRPRQPTTQVGN